MLISDRTPKSSKYRPGSIVKPVPGEQPPVVVGLVVVHVDAVPVHRFAEAVPGAVQHVGAVAGAAQDRRRRPIDFPAAKLAAIRASPA